MYQKLSKAQCSHIRRLRSKRYRWQEQAFLLEGKKSIYAALNGGFTLQYLIGTATFFHTFGVWENVVHSSVPKFQVDVSTLSSLSSLTCNQDGLAVVKMKPSLEPILPTIGISLVLDDIQNPGNLGTMIRIADWYNIKHIFCSKQTVDCYNPKVLQASMGSFSQVHLHYVHIQEYLSAFSGKIIGSGVSGTSLHRFNFPDTGLLVMGNEVKGMNPSLQPYLDHTVAIPRYGQADSLNVAIATAIICDHWSKSLTSNIPTCN